MCVSSAGAHQKMGKSRTQRRAEKGERCISVYPPDTSLGWRVIYHVSKSQATAKLATGEWREVHDENHNFMGCQVLATFKQDEDLPSGASSSSITVRECELNAGLGGRSHTVGLSEDRRISRRNQVGHPLPPEDAIELAKAKVSLWPWPMSRKDDGSSEPVYGDRAVRCYPKPSR
jgi:hypothetical protein